MDHIKRIIVFLLSLALLFSGTACEFPATEWLEINPYSDTSDPLPEFATGWENAGGITSKVGKDPNESYISMVSFINQPAM
jgi:hypothetical protein